MMISPADSMLSRGVRVAFNGDGRDFIMLIYKLTNTVNGKIYIGLTTQSLSDRMCGHRRAARKGSPQLIARAIRKYGFEAFTVEEIATASSLEELRFLEVFYIAESRSAERSRGYNRSLGGEGAFGVRDSKATRAKKSARMQGFKHSEETKALLSKLAKERGAYKQLVAGTKRAWADPERRAALTEMRKGRTWSDETRAKSIAARVGQKHGRTLHTIKMEARMAIECGSQHRTEVYINARTGKISCAFCRRRTATSYRERRDFREQLYKL
jgi:group I intron endonuclease